MSLRVAARLIVFPPYKIADLQENDTSKHDLDLSSHVPRNTKAVLIKVDRMAGAGRFEVHPMNGALELYCDTVNDKQAGLIPIVSRTLTWSNSVANDDWDVYLLGYYYEVTTA